MYVFACCVGKCAMNRAAELSRGVSSIKCADDTAGGRGSSGEKQRSVLGYDDDVCVGVTQCLSKGG